jgi:tetratricopeptide (TPR) repeat protein
MKIKICFVLGALSLVLIHCAPSSKKIARDQEKDPQYQYEKAVVAMRYGLVDEAIKYIEQALALDANHAASYNLLGLAQFKNKNYAAAAEAYKKYLGFNPKDSEAAANLGFVYEEMGESDKAETAYKNSVALDDNANANFGLAKLYFEQKKLPEALDYAQKSIVKNSRFSAAHNLLGVILNQLGRYEEAVISFQNALKLAPDDVNLSINLGIAYVNIKDYAKAREIFEKTLPQVQDPSLKAKINEYLKLIEERSIRGGKANQATLSRDYFRPICARASSPLTRAAQSIPLLTISRASGTSKSLATWPRDV